MTKKDNGTPREDDTGKISRVLHAQIAAANPGGMGDDSEVLKKLAHLVKESGGGNGGSRFLGLDRDSWMKMILAWVVAAGMALGAWHLAVRDALQVRPTSDQVKHEVRGTFETHNDSSAAHPPIQHRLDKLSDTQKLIRESQIRQEETDKTQTETLKLIQVDISRLRRGR